MIWAEIYKICTSHIGDIESLAVVVTVQGRSSLTQIWDPTFKSQSLVADKVQIFQNS